MDQYTGVDLEYILGPCDMVLCAASISTHDSWLRHNCLPQPVWFWCYSQSVKWQPVVIMCQCIAVIRPSQDVWRFLTLWPSL